MKQFHCDTCARSFRTEQGLGDHRRDSHGAPLPQPGEQTPCCIECDKPTSLVYGEAIYPHRPDLYFKRFWLCDCGAYCGCHGVTTRALGNPCGPETRRARMAAHAAFDPLWKSRRMGRRDAYTWLSTRMGLRPEQCHVGMMNEQQAREVVFHCMSLRRTASADTHPEGGDDLSAPFMSGAVPKADAQTPPSTPSLSQEI